MRALETRLEFEFMFGARETRRCELEGILQPRSPPALAVTRASRLLSR